MSISSISTARAVYSADNSPKVLSGPGRLDTTDVRPHASQAAVSARQASAVTETPEVRSSVVTGSMGRDVDVYL